MNELQDMLDTADAAKIHAEINQFRNQEFLIASFALAFFGGTAKYIIDNPVFAVGLIFILACLLLWHNAISSLRTRLCVYLVEAGLSKWEIHYRDFADRVTFPSQRRVITILFMVLGGLGAALPYIPKTPYIPTISTISTKPLPSDFDWIIGVSLLAYWILAIMLGFPTYKAQRDHFRQQWRVTLAKGQAASPHHQLGDG